MKRVNAQEPERPKTANLSRPSVLDPALVDKLDMSLLSKELLSDSMSRFHQPAANIDNLISRDTTTSSSSSLSSLLLVPPSPSVTRRRRRRSAAAVAATTTTWSSRFEDVPPVTRHQRRSFEQTREPRIATDCQMEEIDRLRSPGNQKITSPIGTAAQNPPDIKKFDDNNNRSVI